jgi:hypothetical protein
VGWKRDDAHPEHPEGRELLTMTPSWGAWIEHGQHFGRRGQLFTECVYCAHIPRYPITRFGGVTYNPRTHGWAAHGWEFDMSCRDLYPWSINDLVAICRDQLQLRSILTIDPEHRNAG